MKKTFIFLLMLLSCLLFSLGTNDNQQVVEAATRVQDANGNWYWGYESNLDESYYAALSGIADKTAFEDKLHDIISANYREIGYNNNRYPVMYEADEDPNNTNNVLCLYTGVSMPKDSDHSSVWNTEHVWAKSHGFSASGLMPHSDIHHLRVTQNSINSIRGNSGFKEVKGNGSADTDNNGNYWSGDWFEPRDCVKGDVARMMMYMDVRYNGDTNSDGVDLTLVDGSTSSEPKFGDLTTLKKWHIQDPVDDFERRRNDAIHKGQGNRNPFIDHPEYADIIYNTNYAEVNGGGSTDPGTPSTYKVTYVVETGASFNYSDSTEYTSGSVIKSPNSNPVKNGYTFIGWYKDMNRTIPWNFSTDKITYNLTLYAKFEKDAAKSFEEVFPELKIMSQLSFNVNSVTGTSVPTTETMTITFTGSGQLTGGNYDLSQYADFDTELFSIWYNANSSGSSYIKTSQIRLYAAEGRGNSIDITALNGVKIKDVSWTSDKNSPSKTISSDGSTAKIQNTTNSGSSKDNQVHLSSITITYETSGTGTTYELVDNSLHLNYVLVLTQTQYDLYVADNKELKLYVNNVEADYTIVKVGNDYRVTYSVNIDSFTKVYVPKFTYEGLQLTLSGYSAKTLAEKYLNSYASEELVKKYKDCLLAISN